VDLIDQLTNEHREAEDLVTRLGASEVGPERDELVDRLTGVLRLHLAIHARFVEPLAATYLGREPRRQPTTEGWARLTQLRTDPGFAAALDELRAGLARHVDEEEHDEFPALRDKADAHIQALDPRKCAAAAATDVIGLIDLTDSIDLSRDEQVPRPAPTSGSGA
jgi:hypothetical protein